MRVSLSEKLKNFDYVFFVLTLLLTVFGLVMISSATRGGVKGIPSEYFISKQLIYVMIGYFFFFALSFIDIRKFESFSLFLYAISFILLVLVLLIGDVRLGAQRWIDIGPLSLQPSELAKVFVMLFISSYFARIKDRRPAFSELLYSLLIVGVATFLVILQPDLGTAIILLSGWFIASYAAGAKGSHLGAILIFFVIFFIVAVKFGLLHDYQIKRLTVFLNPEVDTTGAGYNITQAKIAIGSGGLTGKGLYSGTQSALRFIPERHTDFIFSVIGEELGFAGSVIFIAVFFLLLLRILYIALTVKDRTGKIFTLSFLFIVWFHFLVNVGMNLGIMPVTGIPLPFVSSGGSFFMVLMFGFGIIQSFWVHRQKVG
jgi:rod shape determining protein RodA